MPETDIQQALARIYALPTREELTQIIDRYVTKEVFRLEIEALRKENHLEIEALHKEIEELKNKPASNRAIIGWSIGIVVSCVVVVGFLMIHLSWK